MNKRFLFYRLPAFVILALILLSGCPTEGDPGETPLGLDGTVWAGKAAADDWITLIFRAASENPLHEKDAVIASAFDTATVTAYTYDGTTREGSLPGSGTFTVDNKAISFTDFKGSGPLELKRLFPDGDDFALIAPMPADLKNTVWVSEGIRTGDWVTFVFLGTDDGNVSVSHGADNTQWPREYSYNDETKTGSIAYLGHRDGGFSITGNTLRVADFYGHGSPVDFRRVR
jgi:hypothetical protein